MGILDLLDLVIGLIFIFFLLSLVTTAIQEVRSSLFKLRSQNLEIWILDTLNLKSDEKNSENNGLGNKIVDHILIKGLVRKGRKPSYIPQEHFVNALLDTLNNSDETPYTIDSLKDSVKESVLLPKQLKSLILQSISEAKGELESVRKNLGDWFDNTMDRVAGTYKNKQQLWIIIWSFIIAIVFNADAIMLSKYLYENGAERERIVLAAEAAVEDNRYIQIVERIKASKPEEATIDSVKNVLNEVQMKIDAVKEYGDRLKNYDLPLGWSDNPKEANSIPVGGFWPWFNKIIGLIISGYAISLGAPFWFDLLNKLVNLRRAGKQPPTKQSTA